jgi:hypothetical protein
LWVYYCQGLVKIGVNGERYEMRCDSVVTKTSFSDDDVEPESVSIEGREDATFLKVEVDDLLYRRPFGLVLGKLASYQNDDMKSRIFWLRGSVTAPKILL